MSPEPNAFTDKTVAADYALLQAAEAAGAACFSHFLIVTSDNRTTSSTWVSPSTSNTNWSGGWSANTAGGRAFGSSSTVHTPGQALTFVSPGVDLYIRGMNASGNYSASPNLFSVQDVIEYTGARVARSERQVVHQSNCASQPQPQPVTADMISRLPPVGSRSYGALARVGRPDATVSAGVASPRNSMGTTQPLIVYPRISPASAIAPQPQEPSSPLDPDADDVWVETSQGWVPLRVDQMP